MSLVVYGENGQLGKIVLHDGILHGSNKGVQGMADAAVRRTGSAEDGYAALAGYGNGYLQVEEEPDLPPSSPADKMRRLSMGDGDVEFE